MEDWKEYKLGDIGTIVGGATPSTKDSSNYDGNIAWITPKDLSNLNCRYISHGERMISQKGFDDCSCRMLPKNSILFSSRAPIGYVAIAQNALCTNQGFKSIIPNNEIVDSLFLYYLLVYYKPVIENMGSGTTFKEVSGSVMKALTVNIPNIDEQKRIAAILSSLDDKIELNRRINGNLEQQVQALFKAWFVDFEPFKNGKFVDSEFGRIPEGWNIVEANHFMTIFKDSINPTKNPMCLYTHYSIPAFDEALTPEIQFGHKIKSNKFLVRSGMTLFSKLNPRIKRIWFINEASDNSICSTEFIPYESLGQNCYFLYCYLNSNMFYSQAMSLVNGATGSHQRFSPNETLKFLFAYKKEIVEEFNVLVAPTLKEMSELSLETRKIAKLRDTLLPRLMSGELNINTITE